MVDRLNESYFPYHCWKELGLQLGLLKHRLDIIENDNRRITECLIECLSAWLKGEDKVKEKQTRSWKSLAIALDKIEQNDVAEKIRIKCDV